MELAVRQLSPDSVNGSVVARIRESTGYVVRHTRDAEINALAIERFVRAYPGTSRSWWKECPVRLPDLGYEETLRFLFCFNSISFSYWGEPKWRVRSGGRLLDGTWAMLASLASGYLRTPAVFSPENLSRITLEQVRDLLEGDGDLPLLEARWRFLRSLGEKLLLRFEGSCAAVLEESCFNAERLLEIILTELPFFWDSSSFHGRVIEFHKRAQLLVADIDVCLRRKVNGALTGVENLTACADYKLPQALRHLGILSLAEGLRVLVDAGKALEIGSEEEVSIRSATIQAVDSISHRLCSLGRRVTPMQVNDFLWLYAQQKRADFPAYHRVRTTAY